ncbi:MAG: phosphotransferase [Gammaproteobacteria bacterium]
MVTPAGLDQADLDRLCRTLGVAARDLKITALGGGLYERSYRLSSDGGDWVVRLPVGGDKSFGLELATEQRLLEKLSAAELTPPMVTSEPSEGVLITHYLSQATPWRTVDAREPDNITRIAKRLRDLHRPEGDLPSYRATRIAEAYRRVAGEQQRLTPEQLKWGGEFLELARAYDAESSPATLCHNDLAAANILDDGRLWFIDFEYAVRAEPILDLASLASMNDFDEAQQACLLDAYYQDAAPPFSTKKFADVIRLSRLVSFFWALAYRRTAREAAPLDRFVENVAAMLR